MGSQCSLVEFKDSCVRDVPSVAELIFSDVSDAARFLEMSGNCNPATEGIPTRTQTSAKSVWKPEVLLVQGSRIGSETVAL